MLNKEIKYEVFSAIIGTPKFLGKYEEYDGILTFLSKIWDLRDLPSEDSRYKNAYEDARQHIVNNDDWPIEYLFLERLQLINGDEKHFVLFLETVVSPMVRNNKDEIIFFVSFINKIIQPTGFKLILTDYFEALPVYKYKENKGLIDLPIDIIANNILIYFNPVKSNIVYPSFILFDKTWDDYGHSTSFELVYKPAANSSFSLGRVKIMKRNTKSTKETLQEKFTDLSVDYCSLGQTKTYYTGLKEVLGANYNSFLLAIRDVATFPRIHEQFENDDVFEKSIIRGYETERLARTIRFEIEKINPNEYYKFNYIHKPPYSDKSIALNFDFEYNTDFEHRIYALIGKNGTGKTKILSSLAKNLSEQDATNFSPRKPTYGKVFTVSYSVFDKFEIPESDAIFNYVYCGLKKNNGSIKSNDELFIEFYEEANEIGKKNNKSHLVRDWKEVLLNFMSSEVVSHIRFEKVTDEYGTKNIFDLQKFLKIKDTLSSGQSIILYVVTKILANIRLDSLILYDEPETHLHPNAISALLNTLFDLVKRFESFCVIATHSPIVIQEIPARNIFVIKRENNEAIVDSLERESFGENLTVITQEIFGNGEVPKHFISLIKDLIAKDKTYTEILSILETDNLPVTSNVRLYIKALMPSQQ
jgi:predicted ATPase